MGAGDNMENTMQALRHISTSWVKGHIKKDDQLIERGLTL